MIDKDEYYSTKNEQDYFQAMPDEWYGKGRLIPLTIPITLEMFDALLLLTKVENLNYTTYELQYMPEQVAAELLRKALNNFNKNFLIEGKQLLRNNALGIEPFFGVANLVRHEISKKKIQERLAKTNG